MKLEIPSTLRAVVVREAGGPEQLRLEDVPLSPPAPGEALIRVQASGVNFLDVYLRRGDYAAAMPFTPGTEVAGTIVAIGGGAASGEFSPGDRVAFLARTGGYAEYVTAPVERLIPIGDAPVEHAMALFQGVTAQFLTHDAHPVRAGESVLVHAAAGGVGTMLVQYAKAKGAFVIGTVSTPEKAEIAKQAGADSVIVGTQVALSQAVREILPDGVDVAFDASGKPTFQESLHAVRKRGHVVLYGAAGGAVPAFDPAELRNLGSLTLTYTSIYHHIETTEELRARTAAVLQDLKNGTLRVLQSQGFDFDRVAEAHALLESRATSGKLYLRLA